SFVPSHSSRLHGLPSSVHGVVAGFFPSSGQLALLPEQCSAGSHSPADGRQTMVVDLKASTGQVAVVPVQISAMSQAPAAARQTVPALPGSCTHAGTPAVPLHTSVVQTLPSSVHAVPAALTRSVGQLGVVPVQVSARSHSLTAARQSAPGFPAAC